MFPFRILEHTLLSENAKDKIVQYLLSEPPEVDAKNSQGIYGRIEIPHENAFALVSDEIDDIVQRCTLKCGVALLYIHPKRWIQKHLDHKPDIRVCNIIVPLHPKVGYSGTMFWANWTDSKPIAVLKHFEFPALLNIQSIHSVMNTSFEPRINFQLTFSDSYATVYEAVQNGTLFRT